MHSGPQPTARELRGVIRRLDADPLWRWRHAGAEAERALRRWWHSPAEHKSDAYAGYVAARDREAAAIEELRMRGLR
jgi:hypothetical protein